MGRYGMIFLSLVVLFASVTVSAKMIPATGRFVMGDLDSKSDAKKVALLNAKQMALEEAGTYLTSLTEVQNHELTNDEISSLSAGIISVRVIDETWSMDGESPVVTITIQATIDSAGLEERINSVREDTESVAEFRNMQDELAVLKAELEQLKTQARDNPPQAEDKPSPEEPSHQRTQETINRLLSLEQVRNASLPKYRGQPELALADLDRAIELDPNSYFAYLKRAQVNEARKDYQSALRDINSALKLKPGSANGYALRGRILTKMGQSRRAVRSFDRGIKANEKCTVCYLGRGVALLQSKQPRKAYSDFEKACKLGSKQACNRARQMQKMREKAGRQGGKKGPPR